MKEGGGTRNPILGKPLTCERVDEALEDLFPGDDLLGVRQLTHKTSSPILVLPDLRGGRGQGVVLGDRLGHHVLRRAHRRLSGHLSSLPGVDGLGLKPYAFSGEWIPRQVKVFSLDVVEALDDGHGEGSAG